MAAFAKKLRTKKIVKALSEDERARLVEPLATLTSDPKALSHGAGG
jgi:hypothetical protein